MPILKSLSRKTPDFRQALKYVLDKESTVTSWIACHNIHCTSYSIDQLVQAFTHNDNYRKRRKNGNALYHTILAFSQADQNTLKNNPWILENIAYEFFSKRTNGLGVGVPHWDTDSPHIHFILSANEYQSSKSTRISKAEFSKLKKHLEQYIQKEYPQIQHSRISHSDTSPSNERFFEL